MRGPQCGLAQTAATITAAGGSAEALSCDVKDGAKVDQLVDAVVEKWKRLDILVNNAGITLYVRCPG